MKKYLALFLMCILLSGCASLIPRLTFDTKNTVPQQTEKSKAKFKCSGKIEYYPDGKVKSCSKGYYSQESTYNKQERKMTFTERIKSMINSLAGWGFWGLVLLFILCPSLIGLVLGRLIEGATGVAKTTLTAVSRAVQGARKNGRDLNTALESELDKNQKDYIAYLKNKEKIK